MTSLVEKNGNLMSMAAAFQAALSSLYWYNSIYGKQTTNRQGDVAISWNLLFSEKHISF
jgi:hypothetical protein